MGQVKDEREDGDCRASRGAGLQPTKVLAERTIRLVSFDKQNASIWTMAGQQGRVMIVANFFFTRRSRGGANDVEVNGGKNEG